MDEGVASAMLGVALEGGGLGGTVAEGEAVEHPAGPTISRIPSAQATGPAARLLPGALRQALSACLRYGRG